MEVERRRKKLKNVTGLKRRKAKAGWGEGTDLAAPRAALHPVGHVEVINPRHLRVPGHVHGYSPPEAPEGHVIRGTTSL